MAISRRGSNPHDLAVTSDVETTPSPENSAKSSRETVGCIIGIDFGRTKCEAAVAVEDGSVALIPLEIQNPGDCFSLPSYVSVGVGSRAGEWEVGLQAVSRAKAGHPYTFHDLTLLLGKKVEALSPQDIARWAFAVHAGVADKALVECSAKDTSPDLAYPEQVAAMLLSTIKQRAEDFTGKRVAGAVVSVPAAYNRTQRQALRDACSIAGLHVQRLVISSTASAVASAESLGDRNENGVIISKKTVVMVDCGGGSLDVTLARLGFGRGANGSGSSSTRLEVHVEATAGNLETGGEALTDRLFEHFASEARALDNSPKTATPAFSRRLRRACILAQKILSISPQATIDLPPWQPRRGTRTFTPASGGVAGFTSSVSRVDFENLCEEVWDPIVGHVDQVLRLANVKKEEIDAILVTGGAMQVSKLREVLGDCFAQQRDRIVDLPKHTAAVGAALIAARSADSLGLQEPTPLALGIRSSSGDTLVIVPPSTPVPTRQARLYYASCQSEITFDILEGLLEKDDSRSPGTSPRSLEHCMGRVLIDGSRASALLILKLEIVFEIDAADCLTVIISDSSNNRTTRLQVAGDETCLSAEAIALGKATLSQVLSNAVATKETNAPSSLLGLTPAPETLAIQEISPIDTLRTCVAKLKPMVLANGLGVCIPPGDLFVLRSKIEQASSWLDQIDASQQRSENTDKQRHTAQEYLHQIRVMHLSSTASSAFSQLRQELDLLN
ncbi:hypothetical protein PRNP1_009361 [Phytophthora ramorum]